MVWKIAIGLIGLLFAGCGSLERDNPLDPKASIFIGDLETAIIGFWSLENEEENQVYNFKSDGSVDLSDYSNPGGGEVDRNATYPQTLLIRFSGTYTLGGTLLRISFSESLTNTTEVEPPPVPSDARIVEIIPQGRNVLTFKDNAGERSYTRFTRF
jgi:hypothetical protein